MFSEVLLVFALMMIVVLLMAIGVIFGRKPIAGSCGGMAAVGMESECDVCGGDKSRCDKTVREGPVIDDTSLAEPAGRSKV